MKKVLIVDDLFENRYVLEKLMESQRLQVISAGNGKEALEKAREDQPDLVISDILMPVMDGYALCKTWKSDERLKDIPFIFYTATYTAPKDKAFALALGADRFIIKPQEPLIFMDMLKEFLSENSAHRTIHQPLGSEMEFFRQYNDILFRKLEKKVTELEQVNQRLEREIDEHKQARENLFKLTQAVEESPAAILLTDLDGRIEYANRKFFQISGYEGPDVIGRGVSVLKSEDIHPDTYRDLWDTIRSNRVWRGELCNKRKDGELFWVYLTMSPLKNHEGLVTHYMAMIEDISERRKLEAQLRQAQKLEGIGQLAGGVAHDFNNILTAIIGYGDLAYSYIRDENALRGHLKQIMHYAEKASTITQSLLAFSRKQATHPSHFNLNELIVNFQKFLHHLLPENIEIQTKCISRVLSVLVDQVQIEQVIMNLATNARDAMPRGGRFVITTNRIELDEEYIHVHGYGKIGSYAEMAFSDTGTGMDQQTQEKIFDPFFTTKEPGKGTGLGMAIVYGIVKQHNGFVSVYSELGKGSLFRILLPIVEAVERKDKILIERTAPPRGTETILIAEDEPGIRDLLTTILSESGYQVLSASNGEEAVRIFQEQREKVALVILDGVMPKKSGKEACNDMRALAPDVKVIFMSGYSEDMINLDETKDQNIAFLQKPVLPTNILKTVREILDGPGGVS